MCTILTRCCWFAAAAVLVVTTPGNTTAPRTNDFQERSSNVEVRFRFQESVIILHEPVVLSFEVHNGLKQPITVTVGALVRQFFDFSLTTPSGEVLHKDPYEGQVDIVTVGEGKVTVQPGADYKEPLVMNRWFPFATPGTYTLTSRLTSDIETVDGPFHTQSQAAKLRVNPRDAARLDKICAELARQAERASSIAEAQFPSLALSYVDDPIAVPYLARLLSAHTLSYEKTIPGLERIGNGPAVEALLSALDDNYGDIAGLAARALARMQERIADPRLRDRIKFAVERSAERSRTEFIRSQIAYLDYRSPGLQHSAIQNLMRVQGGLEQAEPVLQRLANDSNQPADVREAAKDALQQLHSNKN
jgi:hypothetical protein